MISPKQRLLWLTTIIVQLFWLPGKRSLLITPIYLPVA